MSLYNCKQEGSSWRITKFDPDLNPEGSYLVSAEGCECPAGIRPTCRHRKMLPLFLALKYENTSWFLNYDNQQQQIWQDPTGQARESENRALEQDLASEASSNEVEVLNPSDCESSYELAVDAKEVTAELVPAQPAPGKIWRKI